jgi:uncharacterized protein YbjT (DUF2867 family)
MIRKILILGATGMLGGPVVDHLLTAGHQPRVLSRHPSTAQDLFSGKVELVPGSAESKADVAKAMAGCEAVHINLTQEVELTAVHHVLELAAEQQLQRITYVSATTAYEENRWFPLVESKLQAEELLRQSGIPYSVFCPTWAMETLHNFVHGDRAVIIIGKNPPPLHFFAAAEFGRIVAGSYADDRALGKRLFVHGPEAISLPVALERFLATCHPDLQPVRLPLWQANLIAKITRRKAMASVVELIDYFDQVGEPGDPAETNKLFGAPTITLEAWFEMPGQAKKRMPY